MDNQAISVSHYKIISLIIFISAALFASLFVFHENKKPKALMNVHDEASLFSVGRELKSFTLITGKQEKFTEKNLQGHWTLLFFGFTHCADVCPVTLSLINQSYAQLKTLTPNLQVVLVSLDPERDSTTHLQNYIEKFNSQFIGTTGKLAELRKLQSQFGIFSLRDETNTSPNYQIKHTASILLLNPKGEWAGVFKYGMTKEQFVQVFADSVKLLG